MIYRRHTGEGNLIYYSVTLQNKFPRSTTLPHMGMPNAPLVTSDELWDAATLAAAAPDYPTAAPDNLDTMMESDSGPYSEDGASSWTDGQRLYVIDLEEPPYDNGDGTVNAANWVTVINTWKATFPYPAGIYRTVPRRSYAGSQTPGSAAYITWQAENDTRQSIADAVDILYPSLYTFEADQSKWTTYAENNISEARRLGGTKPVYPFIWPLYHSSADPASLAGTYVGDSYWRHQIQTCLDNADGCVVWGNFPAEDFNSTQDWWKVLSGFL